MKLRTNKKKGKDDVTSQNLISVGSARVDAIKWNKQEQSLLETVLSDDYT